MREKASVLSDLSNLLGAVGLSHPKRVQEDDVSIGQGDSLGGSLLPETALHH